MDELIRIYQKQIKQLSAQLIDLKRKSKLIGLLRILSFLVFIALFYLFFERGNFSLLLFIVFVGLGVFAVLIHYHNRVKYAIELNLIRQNINQEEIARYKMNLSDIDGGNEFIDKDHPYTSDLDIFGDNSVFSLVNRTSTIPGKIRLASNFEEPLPREEIIQHQEAVRELTPMIEWRQKFQASGLISEANSQDHKVLEKWLEKDIRSHSILKFSKYALPILSLSLLGLLLFYNWPIYPFVAIYLLNLFALKKTNKHTNSLYKKTQSSVSTLGSISRQLQMIEGMKPDCSILKDIHKTLTKDSKASFEIRKLYRILDFFQGRSNLFYAILNTIFLLDLHLIDLAERWKERNGNKTREWFNILGMVDTISSMAGFSFANPEFSFPKVIENTEAVFKVKQAGHPLIEKKHRISNDFTLKGAGSLALITGSNMSGKSTFLRTLGVNCVLAQMGAPVCVRDLEMTSTYIFSSMRIVDDLNQKMSSFYAELNRLKNLLDFIEEHNTVIYLLDEVLMGTNSHDRHKGSEALIRQLIQTRAMGLIATHDLELGKLAEKEHRIVNFCFTSNISNGSITFDYKIRKGIGFNFNASELMKKMGINI